MRPITVAFGAHLAVGTNSLNVFDISTGFLPIDTSQVDALWWMANQTGAGWSTQLIGSGLGGIPQKSEGQNVDAEAVQMVSAMGRDQEVNRAKLCLRLVHLVINQSCGERLIF